ncbi:MAG: TetR/AcrR family transcriptional regulator [Acidimicrobiales bacterium]
MSNATRVHTKVTRDDWISAALVAVANEPIDQLRVLALAKTLDVSRSSFYWYFDAPSDLLDELMAIWERNTASIVDRSERAAATPTQACLGVFECWADDQLFNPQLDLAVRDWGRRSPDAGERVSAADECRHEALVKMFARHGFDAPESTVRARLLYHSQVGYYAVGTDEPVETRLAYLPYYLRAMTGSDPTDSEIEAFKSEIA